MTADEIPWDYREPDDDQACTMRRVTLTPASAIKIRPVLWAWHERIPMGSLVLLAGREGIGKSTLAYTLAAAVTRGLLPGRFYGKPKAVIVAATEDSWEHTIVPRLMAAGADLEQVFRVDMASAPGLDEVLNLPRDMAALEAVISDADAGLLLLDPLMSRLGNLDTHKDAEVRKALEPLTAMANRTHTAMLGLIHVNKGNSTDPLSTIMGSRAFVAVARAVLFAVADPEDEGLILLGQSKNNLGRKDLPTLAFRIVGCKVADTDEGPVWTGRLDWQQDSTRSVQDVLSEGPQDAESRTATGDAAAWLTDYLTGQGGTAPYADLMPAARTAGHSDSAVKRARARTRVVSTSEGFPRRSFWSLPGTQPATSQVTSSRGGDLTELTELTELTASPSQSSQVSQSSQTTPPGADLTADPTKTPDLWSVQP